MSVLVLSVLKLLNIDMVKIYELIALYASGAEVAMAKRVFDDAALSAPSAISIGTVFTAWSAGRAFHALAEGFHSSLGIVTDKNYFFLRLRSLIFSLFFSLVIAILVIIGLFGNSIHSFVLRVYPAYSSYYYLVKALQIVFVCITLFVIIIVLYKFLPDWEMCTSSYKSRGRMKLKTLFVPSLLSAAVIYLFTFAFSIYVSYFAPYSLAYGSIASLVCIMLWLYGAMYVVLLGFRLSIYIKIRHGQHTCANHQR